ncbi:hypothetical protein EVA_09280 [gut metagenome]|uniref:Uncharacterized protein n=1 Tax=gut metagenome TaxID=749906 RepID=J9GKJ1_9ZZZZ
MCLLPCHPTAPYHHSFVLPYTTINYFSFNSVTKSVTEYSLI